MCSRWCLRWIWNPKLVPYFLSKWVVKYIWSLDLSVLLQKIHIGDTSKPQLFKRSKVGILFHNVIQHTNICFRFYMKTILNHAKKRWVEVGVEFAMWGSQQCQLRVPTNAYPTINILWVVIIKSLTRINIVKFSNGNPLQHGLLKSSKKVYY